jgi:hypothetical protein
MQTSDDAARSSNARDRAGGSLTNASGGGVLSEVVTVDGPRRSRAEIATWQG